MEYKLYHCISKITKMKIIKSHTGQTKQILLRANNTVEVLSYNDSKGKFELDYSIPGGADEFQMQMFFNFK